MEATIKFPDNVIEVLEKPVEKSVLELIAVGLYREGKITLRQAADITGVNLRKMLELLEKHSTYINYGMKELEEDIAYAASGE